jgi:hypothetical protein
VDDQVGEKRLAFAPGTLGIGAAVFVRPLRGLFGFAHAQKIEPYYDNENGNGYDDEGIHKQFLPMCGNGSRK